MGFSIISDSVKVIKHAYFFYMGVAGIMNINIFLLWLIKSREALGSGCFKNNVFNFFYFYFSQEIHLFLS